MRAPTLLLPLVPIALAACRGDAPRAGATDSTAVRIAVGTPHGRVALELWQLRPGLTFAQWFQQHSEDEVTPAAPGDADGPFGAWCVKSAEMAVVGGIALRRTSFFYVPDAPAGLALPDSATPDLARGCQLGLIGVEIPLADSAAAAGLADSVRGQLEAVFGRAREGPVTFFGSAFWSRTARFAPGGLEAVSALAVPPARTDSTRARVLAFALLPLARLSLDGEARGDEVVTDTFPLHEALAIAALDSARTESLRRLWTESGRTDSGGARTPAALAGPLARWVDAAAALPPARRAAALYAADRVLERALCAYGACDDRADSGALDPLRARGARFAWAELGVGWLYERSWLMQARLLDRDSPLGNRIFLHQLGHAFDFSGTCEGGMDGWERVVANAERYLERLPESAIAAEVHFLAGEAWTDVVALAAGAAGDYADTSRYAPRAREARTRALAHYRAAIAARPASPLAQAAWRRAWWLLSALPPASVRFFCVYD